MNSLLNDLFHFLLENHLEPHLVHFPEYRQVSRYAQTQDRQLRETLPPECLELLDKYQENQGELQFMESKAVFLATLALGLAMGRL